MVIPIKLHSLKLSAVDDDVFTADDDVFTAMICIYS